MATYHKLDLPKMTVYLSSGELVYLLQKDKELFKKGLQRGKAFGRYDSKSAQYEKKFAEHEADTLKEFLE